MQYFQALKTGQKRVANAREYLNKLTNGKAMPALALRDNNSNVWEPVGEENLYAFVDESAGTEDATKTDFCDIGACSNTFPSRSVT